MKTVLKETPNNAGGGGGLAAGASLLTAARRPGRQRWLGGFGQGDKWIFCLRAAQIGGGSGEGLTKRTRWNHTPAFEAKVTLTALEGEKTRVRRRWRSWRGSLSSPEPDHELEGASARRGGRGVRFWRGGSAGGPCGGFEDAARQARGAVAGNDFLAGALGKAGMLRAKR
jgi:transposase